MGGGFASIVVRVSTRLDSEGVGFLLRKPRRGVGQPQARAGAADPE